MGKKYIHCTCGQPMEFIINKPLPSDSPEQATTVLQRIRIGGGAWVINANSRIPKVVITEVTEDELAALEGLDTFQNMKRRGFITVRGEENPVYDSRDLPDNMEKKDNTSQILDEDHAKGTDTRLEHEGLRAAYGEGNQFAGEQPDNPVDGSYGAINA